MNREEPRRRPGFEPGAAVTGEAGLKKLSDGGGSQRQWLSDAARGFRRALRSLWFSSGGTDCSITSGIAALLLLLFAGCSPLKTSPHDEMHQWELTVHEVQTNLDDLRHDINCFQTEMQILDGRIKYFENALVSLKQQDLEKQQAKIDQLAHLLHQFEKKWGTVEKGHESGKVELEHLTAHANETSTALTQFKDRIEELEREILSQNRKLEAFSKVKGNLETLAKTLKGEGHKIYKVKPGDSLEKIAKIHKTAVDKIKKLNELDQDLIVVGQELKIPNE